MNLDEEAARFARLLDEEREEQAYQAYLEQNTRFIPREFVENHVSDLALFFASSLSAPTTKPISSTSRRARMTGTPSLSSWKSRGRAFSRTSITAIFRARCSRLISGRRGFSRNEAGFLASVSAVQVPRHMASNPTYNKYVLVFGRRAEYEGNADRRRLVRAAETDDFKIMTFDSLAEGLSQKGELAVGSRHNQFIDILSDEVIDAGMYTWMEPTQLRVSKALREKLSQGGSNHFLFQDGQRHEVLSYVAPLVRVRAA